MEILKTDRIKEVRLVFKNKKYINVNPGEKGKPAFERCVELAWLDDKMKQINPMSGTLLDFGCNKAQYIRDFKKQYELTTYGIDAKKGGKKFVDKFYN